MASFWFPASRQLVRFGLASLIVGLAGPAFAADAGQAKVDGLALSADDLVRRSERIARQAQPGQSHLSDNQALVRYEDHLFQHMIGQHQQAAEGFFTLVASGALKDAGLFRDSEWYLAESLLELGNIITAEGRFRAIVDDARHPFREDGVRRLLELYAMEGNTDKFEALYQSEIVGGRVQPSPMITYTVAKSFYRQGRADQARKYFNDVPVGTSWYHKAQYFLGVMAVVDEDYATARPAFAKVAQLSVETLEERQVHDLALLALGRLAYHENDFLGATEAYGEIGGDSQYHADKLYEVIWAFIKQEEWSQAARGVEIFLLAFPEHQYTAQLKVVEGHLHMAQVSYDAALSSYEGIVRDYGPIRERFREMGRSEDMQREYFKRVLDLDTGAVIDASVPAYALAMMRSDPDLSQAIGIYRTLEQERRDVDISESIIEELTVLMSDSAGGPFAQLRFEALLTSVAVLNRQVDLLQAEEEVNRSRLGEAGIEASRQRRQAISAIAADVEAALRSLEEAVNARVSQVSASQSELTELLLRISEGRQRSTEIDDLLMMGGVAEQVRLEAETQLAGIEADLAQADRRVGELRQSLESIAVPTTGGEADQVASAVRMVADALVELRRSRGSDGVFDTIDASHAQFSHALQLLADAVTRSASLQGTEGVRLRERFEAEVTEVAEQRLALERTRTSAEGLSVALTREGFGRMEDFFADSILKADLGIVNVYWAQRVEVAEQLEEARIQRTALLADLDARFKVIRQKLGKL